MAKRRGISLLEVFLSLLLLGVVFGVWVLGHFGRSEITLDSAGQLLVEDLRAAQSRALVHADATYVLFEGHGYTAVDSLRIPLLHPRTGLDFVRDYARDAVFEGVEIELADFEAVHGVLFDARGEIASGGRVVLRFGEDRREVVVDSESGRISSRPLGLGLGPGAAVVRASPTSEPGAGEQVDGTYPR